MPILRRSKRNKLQPARLPDFITNTENTSLEEYDSAEQEDDFDDFSALVALSSYLSRQYCQSQQMSSNQLNTAQNLFWSFNQDPEPLEEALSRPDSHKSLMENNTCTLQDLPQNRKAIKLNGYSVLSET